MMAVILLVGAGHKCFMWRYQFWILAIFRPWQDFCKLLVQWCLKKVKFHGSASPLQKVKRTN